MCNDESGAFGKPCISYELAGAVHVAGPAKHEAFDTQSTGNGRSLACIQRGTVPDQPVPAASLARAHLRAA